MSDLDPQSVGERVEIARKSVGLRQRHLAQASGLGAPTLNDIIHGRRRGAGIGAMKLYDLARSLGVRMESLLGVPYLGGPVDIEGPHAQVLTEAAERYGWWPEDVQMLQHIEFRGRHPSSVEDWWFIYESIHRTIVR